MHDFAHLEAPNLDEDAPPAAGPLYRDSFLYRFLSEVANHDASAVVQNCARGLLAEMDESDGEPATPSVVPAGSESLAPPSEAPATFPPA